MRYTAAWRGFVMTVFIAVEHKTRNILHIHSCIISNLPIVLFNDMRQLRIFGTREGNFNELLGLCTRGCVIKTTKITLMV